MMCHTIITAARDIKNNCTIEELKALARGMDHSVHIAEASYCHEKEKRQIVQSAIICKVLKLNDWQEEMKMGVEVDIELQAMSGGLELIEPDINDKDDDNGDTGHDGTKTKKRKIRNMEDIFSPQQTELVRNLFGTYIADKVKFPNKPIKGEDIKEKFFQQMKGLPKKSPYLKLEQLPIERIVTKICTLITQDN